MIIDADSHLFEQRNMWRDYTPAHQRELALNIEDDRLGYSWLTFRGVSLGIPAHPMEPADFESIGRMKQRWRASLPNDMTPYDEMPRDHWDPKARLERLGKWGIDEAVLFPNWGFIWQDCLVEDLDATRVNLAAWNRWAAEVAQDGAGQLHPAGHLTLDGPLAWIQEQCAALSAAGIRLAMVSPGLIDGRRPSHEDFDPVWQAFVDNGISPAWHINNKMRSVIDREHAWTDNDHDSHFKVVTGVFTNVAAQVALCDLAVNGVFQRFPDLRVYLAEVGVEWLPSLGNRLDNITQIVGAVHGRPFNPSLDRSPGEYMRDQVLAVASFPSDTDLAALDDMIDMVAYGSDYPHPEGLADPLADYQAAMGPIDDGAATRKFYGGNVAKLLR